MTDDPLKYSLIRRAIMQTPWAILPGKLDEILGFMAFKAHGGQLELAEIEARFGRDRQRDSPRPGGNVAVLPVTGTLSHRMNLMTNMSGGTSYEDLAREFRALQHNSQVGAIVLDVDSPGGSVDGIDELADEIYSARGRKPIVAVANSLMASAAYWIGSAADEIVVSPSSEVGSIGVIAAHQNVEGALDQAGIDMTIISAGRYKAEANPYEPLDEEAQAEIQRRVNEAYDRFVTAVARHRGDTTANVRDGYGQGRIVGAKRAVQLNMADRVATLDQTIERLGAGGEAGGRRAEGAIDGSSRLATRRRWLELERMKGGR